jgi:F-type H+-transporting ATPase subunit gamma
MATLKQIRRRIRSVKSTQQITKAMEMVAAAKLRRAQDRVVASRPYSTGLRTMLQNLSAAAGEVSHPLFEVRPVRRRALVLIASDKGLCGSFNMNIFRQGERLLAGLDRTNVELIPVGRRANQYFGKRGWSLPHAIPELGDQVDPMMAKALAQDLIQLFARGEVDQVEILYTKFVSTVSRRVETLEILPVAPESVEAGPRVDYIYEPTPAAIFTTLLPRYVENRVLQAMAESLASEHSSRMVSMGGATKNAREVIDHLTLVGNKLRQAAITREISEIVGGAESQK